MLFRDYIKNHGIRHSFVAEKLGISHTQMSRMMQPGFKPTLDVIDAIETLTYGNVKYKDWITDYKATLMSKIKKENID